MRSLPDHTTSELLYFCMQNGIGAAEVLYVATELARHDMIVWLKEHQPTVDAYDWVKTHRVI